MLNVTESLKDPSLALKVDILQHHLQDEAELRQIFYETINEQQKAEFINSEIIIHSPDTLVHNLVVKHLFCALESHVQLNSLGLVGLLKLMIHLTRNSYEPDICFFSSQQSANFKKDDKLFPPPVFIAEVISPSTEDNDRTIKFEDYAAHGVAEYWIIDPFNMIVEQYRLKNKTYKLIFKGSEGIIENEPVHGFRFDIDCLFDSLMFQDFVEKDKKRIVLLERISKEQENQLIEKDNQLVEQKNQLIEKENQLVEQKNQLIEKENQLVEKDNQLAEKDKIIAELMNDKQNGMEV